jgi:hypothetical protein
MPDVIAVPAAPAAPSSPAPSAPATSTPSTPSTGAGAPETTSAPQTTATETAQQPTGTTEAAPQEQGWKGKDRPQSHDYQGDITKFNLDLDAWEAANPEGEAKPAETKEQPDAAAGEQDGAQAEAGEIADETADASTPEALNSLVTATPGAKEFLESNPKFKGALFEMSRQLARTQPIADVFPTVEDATFANETANRTVSIKSAFEGSVGSPDRIGDAVGMLLDEFVVVDDKGNPVLDADGEKQYGEDAKLMADYFADAKYEAMTGELKEAVASGKLNEHQQRNYQAALEAWDFLKNFNAQSDFERGLPDDGEMDDPTRAWVSQERERIRKEREEIEGNQRTQQTAQQKQEQASYDKANRISAAKHFGGEMDKLLKTAIDSGVHIPEFLLKEVDPATGVNTFVYGVYDRFMMDTIGWSERQKRFIPGKGIPRLKEQYLRLGAAKPSEANQRAAQEFFGRTVADHLPKIFNARLKEIEQYSRSERNRAAQKTGQARANVAPEIAGGSTSRQHTMTDDQAMKQAYADVDKEYAGKFLDSSKRTELAVERWVKLTSGR